MISLSGSCVRSRGFTLATLISFAAVAVAAVPVQARTAFDGDWSVVIVTEKGECDRAYRYPIRIANGTVGYGGKAGFTVSGKVSGNGKVTVTVHRGDRHASGSGRLTAQSGSGRWSGGTCSGIWTAERRG